MRVSREDLVAHIRVLKDIVDDEQEQLNEEYEDFGEAGPQVLTGLLEPIIISLESILSELDAKQVAHDFVDSVSN